jgi:diacylglycerol O-acyltransferase
LESIKLLAKAAQATVNDIVIGLCAGALHRYLKKINKLPDKPLVALVPVSIRPKDSDAHGNQVSAILCNLGTHVEDPVQRLQIIKDSSTEGKAIQNNLSSQAAQNYAMIGGVPIFLVQLLRLSTYLNPAFNLVISNVPGPRSPLYMQGAHLLNIYPVSALYKQQNLNITVTSYEDSLDFGLIACQDFLSEVDQLTEYLEDALDELNAVFGVTKTI